MMQNNRFGLIERFVFLFFLFSISSFAGAFAPETVVLTPNGVKPIQSLKPRNAVICSPSKNAIVVENKIAPVPKHIVICLNNTICLKCAPRQKLYSADRHRFVNAEELKKGDLLVTIQGKTIEVQTVQIIDQPLTVSNLVLSEPYTFYVTEQAIYAHS